MTRTKVEAKKIVEVFLTYCNAKKYQVKPPKEDSDKDWRLDITDTKESTIVRIFHTGTILPQGPKNYLREEFTKLKNDFESNPTDFIECEVVEEKFCTARYTILINDIRIEIKECLDMLEGKIKIFDKPESDKEYRAKIQRSDFALTITQFNNGTLWLQGKTNRLFDDCCNLIEKIANPAENEVIARFISSDEKSLELFSAHYNSELPRIAEDNVRRKIGCVFDYLEEYDKKWFIASECLCLAKIPLPEYSPVVMPASKAFEGFVKKLIVDIGLYKSEELKKNFTFSKLKNNNDPNRIAICKKDGKLDTLLNNLDVCIKKYRHFMMHSDSSKITKLHTQEEATNKVNMIFQDTNDIFLSFKKIFPLI